MKYGICTEIKNAQVVKNLGYDYIEPTVTATAEMSEAEFEAVQNTLASAEIEAQVCNCFFNADKLMCVGETVDFNAIAQYAAFSMGRCAKLGAKVIVFGSGKARCIPDGFDRDKAEQQFFKVLQIVGDEGQRTGITVALEPLPYRSTNLINTVPQAIEFVQRVAHPNIATMADLYHVTSNGETYDAIISGGEYMRHIHISNPDGGVFPKQDDSFDYMRFFRAFKMTGYDMRISIEADTKSLEVDAAASLALLKKYETIGDMQ